SKQASFASGVEIGSPSLRATSTIDRSMIVVDIGSSTASAKRPKQPPTAPVATAASLCEKFDAGRNSSLMVEVANPSAASSDRLVTFAIISRAGRGNN